MTPPQAEFKFIETAHKLDTYGVDPHLVRVSKLKIDQVLASF